MTIRRWVGVLRAFRHVVLRFGDRLILARTDLVLLEWEIDFSLLLVAVCSGMLSRAVLRALVLGMVLTRALGLGRKAGGVHHARFHQR